MSSSYSELCVLDSRSSGIGLKKIDTVSKFLLKQDWQSIEPSPEVDRRLLEITQNQPENSEAFACLRCRVSYPISEKIKVLFNKFYDRYEIDLKDMLACVLDDSGDLFIRIPKRSNNGQVEMIRMSFNWNTLLELAKNQIRPFGAEIIYSYEPELSSLPTWTKNKVQANQELKNYLRSSGILLISAWALIADSTPTRVKEACKFHYKGKLTLEEIERLHGSYLSNYKQAKLTYRKSTGKNYGWAPDSKFLASLDPPQTKRENLEAIDQALRQYLAGPYAATSFKEDEESQLSNSFSDNNENTNEDLIKLILEALQRAGIPIVKSAIDTDRSKWLKDPTRKLAWELYAQGLSQREIAIHCKHKQAWVSKLISEKNLSIEISQEAAVELVRRSEFKSIRQDPQRVDIMIDQFRNYLISSEQEEGISLFQQIIKVALAQ